MAQASEPQRAISRGEGRDALCAALARIVARDGLDGVTFRSVATEAGVTHGLASYHFGNRETMIIEALTWAVRESIQRGRLGEDNATLGEFAADVPALMARSPRRPYSSSSSRSRDSAGRSSSPRCRRRTTTTCRKCERP